jgi:prepilin peptidase CpaA
MTAIGALIVFPILMAIAGCSDLLTMTISNRVSLALVGGFLAMALALHVPMHELTLDLSCGLLVLCVTFTFFCFGWIGGGDAKLAAATAVWLGWSNLLDYGVAASILGGALTIGLLLARRIPLPIWAQTGWVLRLHDQKSGIPYGIALSVAGLIIYPSTRIWLLASGS